MNKYHAKQATFGDEVFDSTVERNDYLILPAREQQGEIRSFRRQPKYVLVQSPKARETQGRKTAGRKGDVLCSP